MPPREKYQKFGLDALTDADLVGVLIGSGQKGLSYSQISNAVIKKINKQCRTDKDFNLYKSLISVDGVGPTLALRILAGIELGRRSVKNTDTLKTIINTSSDSLKHFSDIRSRKRECIKGLYLNARFELVHSEILTIGSLTKAEILPRDILIPAMEYGCAYIVLGHNHPSNSSKPSSADIQHTKKLSEACNLIGVSLLEHLVICPNGSWSSIPY
jgi:DNA repair protein RadC